MSYGYFAEFYDSFTDDVNYDKIEKFVCSLLSREGINGGLLLDLACGTGSLAVRLSEKGYSVIGTDMSPEMLSVAQQKAAVKNADILFLCQDMTQLNLYGTIICTVCTLDSLNHLKSLDEIKKVFPSFRFLRRRAEFSFLTSTPFTSTKKFSVTMRLSMKTTTLFARGKTALTATR